MFQLIFQEMYILHHMSIIISQKSGNFDLYKHLSVNAGNKMWFHAPISPATLVMQT